MKKWIFALLFAAVFAYQGSPAIAGEAYTFGSGPSAGGWNPAIQAGVQLLNKELKGKFSFQHVPSQGSLDNVRRIGHGDFSTTWGHVVQIYSAWNGIGPFKSDGKLRDFRVVARVRAQAQIIAVLAGSPIKSYSDMKGKVVNLSPRGTGSMVTCTNIFKSIGLFDKIKPRYMGVGASARALGDRQVDVVCLPGVPHSFPSLTQLSVQRPVRYINMTSDEQKMVISKHRFYAPITIPPLKDVRGQNANARSIAYDVWWLAHKKMSSAAVYNLIKVAAEPANLNKLSKVAKYWKDLTGNFDALKEHKIYVHPAAARYWKERGKKVPAEIVKGY